MGEIRPRSADFFQNSGKRKVANINANYLINDIGRSFVGKFWASDDFQEIHTMANIAPYLNSTVCWFFQNIEGRTSFGGGLLKIQTYEFENLPVINPKYLNKKYTEISGKLFHARIKNLFELLRADRQFEIKLNSVDKKLRNLDRYIMGDILGLSENEQLEVYKAVVDLVRSRLERAKSAGNNNKKNGRTGINIDAVVDSVVSQIGEGKIKKWYKEKILNQKKLKIHKLPEAEEDMKIEKSLFGWQLKNGKSAIACRSEFEARYLKIWIELGLEKIKVPADEQYLKKCMIELEKLKSEIDSKIDSLVGSILDRKLKKIILHRIWQRL